MIRRNSSKRTGTGSMKTEHIKEKPNQQMLLDDVLKARNMTGYAFAKNILNAHANALTPIRKPGYDPKLSTLLKWCRILDCDINDLFRAEGYTPKGPKKAQ